jgi:hypothetical protein
VRAGEVLQLWERADGLGPVERALALAEAAGADASLLRKRPFGQTNAHLLVLRECLVGGRLSATAMCPTCRERIDFALDPARLQGMLSADEDSSHLPNQPFGNALGQAVDHQATGLVVSWHAPTPDDLAAAAAAPDPEGVLKQRCLTARTADGSAVDASGLPDELVEAVEIAMADADPLAEVLLDMVCPGCATEFRSDLDLASFVWTELDARARRLLHEVDILARAYGWPEPEVLALTEARRAAYLRLVLEGAP